MARTKGWAIALIILTTAFTSVAQILYKQAAPRLPEIITNWPLLGGIACYAFGALLMIPVGLLFWRRGDARPLEPAPPPGRVRVRRP